MTRVYVPTDGNGLRRLHESGVLEAETAYATAVDDEEQEWAAMTAAAEAVAGDVPIVVAADVDGLVAPDEPGPVSLSRPVERSAVAAIHVGDDLAWYATQELPDLL